MKNTIEDLLNNLDRHSFSLEGGSIPENKKNLFESKNLPIKLLSFGLVSTRLKSSTNCSHINHPFLLFQKRKEAFSECMNFDQNNVLYGNSCIGKSMFAAYFYLTLLLQRTQYSTIYVQNFVENFENDLKNMFLWFYDDIINSLPLKIMMNIAFSLSEPKNFILAIIMKEMIHVANSKNKKIIFIQDQIISSSKLFYNVYDFGNLIDKRILVTTSTENDRIDEYTKDSNEIYYEPFNFDGSEDNFDSSFQEKLMEILLNVKQISENERPYWRQFRKDTRANIHLLYYFKK